MKWTTAIGHVHGLAERCADMAELSSTIQTLSVTGLWAVGDILGTPRDLDWVTVALVVDLPAAEVPWLCSPHGSQHWSQATRLSKNPVTARWRSAHAPVWNHRIVRPVLIWDLAGGLRQNALDAVREGCSADFALPAPSPDEFRARMADELAISAAALAARTADYEAKRWSRTPLERIADPLFEAVQGYLGVLEAQPHPSRPLSGGHPEAPTVSPQA